MKITKYLRGIIYGFAKEERGSIAVEAVVILPIMFWTYLAVFATFHSYRTYSVNQKAAYTIGDMISRETNPLDGDYMTGARELLAYLTNSDEADVSVRVTVVQYDAENTEYERDWSQSKGYQPAVTAAAVTTWENRLPVMPDAQRVIVVETFQQYDPPFNTGLAQREVKNFIFTKPRYAPQVLWDDS